MARVDAGSVPPTQQGGLIEGVVADAGMRQRQRFGKRGIGDARAQRGIVGVPGGAHDPLSLSQHVMALPA